MNFQPLDGGLGMKEDNPLSIAITHKDNFANSTASGFRSTPNTQFSTTRLRQMEVSVSRFPLKVE